jgi:hypothetical protein
MLLEKTRRSARAKNSQMIMTTESNAEPYMTNLDAYLMCNSTRGNLIPLFPAVYSGYIITFGRYLLKEDLENSTAFIQKVGQMFVFGAQLGWFGLYEILEDKYRPEAEYLRKLAKCYSLARKYLVFGKMLKPPVLETESMEISSKWNVFGTAQEVRLPAVLSSAWRAEDGTVGLVLTNTSTSSQVVSYLINAKEYGLSKGIKYVVSNLTDKGESIVATYNTYEFRVKEILPGRSALVIQIRAEQ